MRIPLHKPKTMVIKVIAIIMLSVVISHQSTGQTATKFLKRFSPLERNGKQTKAQVKEKQIHTKTAQLTPCTNNGPYYVNDALTTGDVYTTAAGSDGNCGTADAPFATIQHAIDIAAPGDSIYVDAGSYEEQLQITNTSLTIFGAGEGSANIVSPDVLVTAYTDSYGDNKPIVYVNKADLTLANVTVDGASKGTGNYQFEGITYYNATGNVHDCEVANINDGPQNGLQDGLAINFFADDNASRSIIIRQNNVHDFQKNGITADGAGLSVSILNNTITGAGAVNYIAQNGIQVSGGATGSVTNNYVSAISYTPYSYVASGILVYGSNAVTVTSNTITDVQAGVLYYQASGVITKNILVNHAANLNSPYWYAIDVEDGTSSVTQNEISNGGNGSGIEGDAVSGESTAITVSNNKVDNSDEAVVLFVQDDGTATGTVHYNSITNSITKAIDNGSADSVNATCNWYGTTDSAAIAAKLSGPVIFTPYLFSGTDVNLSTPGFQPGNTCARPFLVTLVSKTNVACYGSNTGAIDISVMGGSGRYTYNWSNGRTTQDQTNIPAGTYKVIVTDKSYGEKDSITVTINQPSAPLSATVSNKHNLNCNGDNSGSFTVSASGGTAPYMYNFNGNGFSGVHNYSNLAAGTYNVVVKDNNGCTKSLNVVITQPNLFKDSVVSYKNIRCHGNATGIINDSAFGGNKPYGNYILTGPVNQTNKSGIFKNLPAGTYTITISDAHGCTSIIMQTLTEPVSGCSGSFVADVTNSKMIAVNSLDVSLSPNPSSKQFTLVVKSNSNIAVTIRVINMMGKTVYTTQGAVNQSYVFGEYLNNGVYSVQIVQGTTIKTLKAIKGE